MTRKLEDYLPPVREDGIVTDKNLIIGGTLAVTGATTLAASTSLTTPIIGAATGTSLSLTGAATLKNATAVPATAGAIAAGAPIVMFSSGISIWVTSDAPTHSATKGDLCLNTGGSSTSTRLYINNGTTNWVAITTAS